MNDKKLDVVVSVLNKRFPFIDDIKLRITTSYIVHGEYVVEVKCNYDDLIGMYPDKEIDYEYIDDNRTHFSDKIYISNPYDLFVYPPEDGDKLRKLVLELTNTIGISTGRIQFSFEPPE